MVPIVAAAMCQAPLLSAVGEEIEVLTAYGPFRRVEAADPH